MPVPLGCWFSGPYLQHWERLPALFEQSADDDAVYYIQGGLHRLYVPHSIPLYQAILEEHHDASGHLGVTNTLHSVARYFYWPNMRDSIRAHIAGCVECQRNKSSSQKPMGLLHPLQIPEKRWESISLDFMMPLPKTRAGYDGILVIVDRLSKMMHCFPVHTTRCWSSPNLLGSHFPALRYASVHSQ